MSSYDYPYLVDGLKLVIVGLGIFAIPEIVALLRKDQAIADRPVLGSGWVSGLSDWWKNKWLSMRCAVIGVVVGVIPGLGGSVVDWIAYGHTVQTTKDKSTFGSGEIRGVIGLKVQIMPRKAAALCRRCFLVSPVQDHRRSSSVRWRCWVPVNWKSARRCSRTT